jgi:hypothetical protein
MAALTIAIAIGGCSVAASLLPSSAATVGRPIGVEVSNDTTLPITIVVNGAVVRNIGPHDGTLEPIAADVLGPMPWKVEAKTPSGRVLLTMTVKEGDVVYQDFGDGHGSAQGDADRVDLSCGRLDIWAGPPLFGPVPGPGIPGDCVP